MLVYQNLDIIRRSIEALVPLADRLDLNVIENPSDDSDAIRALLDGYLRDGLLKCCFLFDENISNNAFEVILRRELDYTKHEHVLVTDGDLLPLDAAWLDEEQSTLRQHPEVFCVWWSARYANLPVGTFPDAGNWIPPDFADHGGYIESLTGVWFLMFRGAQLGALMTRLDEHDLHFRDAVIGGYCSELGLCWARTRHARFVHLTWICTMTPSTLTRGSRAMCLSPCIGSTTAMPAIVAVNTGSAGSARPTCGGNTSQR